MHDFSPHSSDPVLEPTHRSLPNMIDSGRDLSFLDTASVSQDSRGPNGVLPGQEIGSSPEIWLGLILPTQLELFQSSPDLIYSTFSMGLAYPTFPKTHGTKSSRSPFAFLNFFFATTCFTCYLLFGYRSKFSTLSFPSPEWNKRLDFY